MRNVLWKAVTPNCSEGSRIVVGPSLRSGQARVITRAEPHTILCYDADTGKLLWHNASDISGDKLARKKPSRDSSSVTG
jgi:outer membrane protein assembly factor BamB